MLAYLGEPNLPLAFRRGWTHGVLALLLLPPLLAGALVGIDRLGDRLRGAVLPSNADPWQLLLLSYIAVWSHPVLDTLNVYGVRWLMPFAERWFYGDVLFIVDLWLILVLGAGVWLSRRRARSRTLFRTAHEWPARVALIGAAAYVVLMWLSSWAAGGIARREVAAITGEEPARIMVGPVPLTPFTREVVAEQSDGYLTADFRWFRSPHLEPASVRRFARGPWDAPVVIAAAAQPEARNWLEWARFPIVLLDSAGSSTAVHFVDLRYAESPDARFGSVSVTVPGRTQAAR